MANATITVTVTTTSPSLTVKSDGADTAVPANKLSGKTPVVGERWVAEVRTPAAPMLTEKET